MIRHICMFKLKEENKEANLREALERLETLRDLPQIKSFQVVTNFKEAPESNYDLLLIFDFLSMEDLDEYQKHPKHLKFGEFISQVREARACLDYEL